MNNAQFDGSAPVEMYAEPERTSVAAILSLVLSILGCCTILPSLISVPLAIFAIFAIKGSKGRVGGFGIAIAGLLIGLLTLALGIAILIGIKGSINAMDQAITQPTAQILIDMQADDFDAARSGLTSPASDVSDEEMIAFRDAYTSTLGNYKSKPSGWGEYFQGWISLGEHLQDYQGQQGMIPIPLNFDNGTALVVIFVDPSSGGMPVGEKIVIIDQDGNKYILPAE